MLSKALAIFFCFFLCLILAQDQQKKKRMFGIIDTALDLQDVNALDKLPFRCYCRGLSCSCCGFLRIKLLRLNESSCINLVYVGEKTAFSLEFTLNEKKLFGGMISANNPPPVCVGLPHTKVFADICIEFNNLQIMWDRLHVCLQLNPRVMLGTVADIHVGCVTLSYDDEEGYDLDLIVGPDNETRKMIN